MLSKGQGLKYNEETHKKLIHDGTAKKSQKINPKLKEVSSFEKIEKIDSRFNYNS